MVWTCVGDEGNYSSAYYVPKKVEKKKIEKIPEPEVPKKEDFWTKSEREAYGN